MLNLFQHLSINAQDKTIDSLKITLKNAKHDTARCLILMTLAETEMDPVIWSEYNEQLLKIAQRELKLNPPKPLRTIYIRHLAYAFNNRGVLANERGNIDSALVYYQRALNLQEEIGEKNGMASTLNNMGYIYNHYGDIAKALEFYHRCLKISEEINHQEGVATVLNNLGRIYVALQDEQRGIDYYKKSLKICKKIEDKEGIASALNNIGAAYDCINNTVMAADYYKQGLLLYKEMGNKQGIATALNNVGMIYHRRNEMNEALKYYEEALIIEKEESDMYAYSYTTSNIANIKYEQGLINEAIKFAQLSLDAAMVLGYPDNINKPAQILKVIYKKLGRHKEAFQMYELELKMMDSINNEQSQKAAVKKQIQYAYEKKEAVMKEEHSSELMKQQAVATEKQRRQLIVIWSTFIGLVLVAGFLVYVFKTLKITRKQKDIIELKTKEVEEKQREILDSIYYARRIQRAMITSEKHIHNSLKRLIKSK